MCYNPQRLYYILITPEKSIKQISPHFSSFLGVYIRFFTRRNACSGNSPHLGLKFQHLMLMQWVKIDSTLFICYTYRNTMTISWSNFVSIHTCDIIRVVLPTPTSYTCPYNTVSRCRTLLYGCLRLCTNTAHQTLLLPLQHCHGCLCLDVWSILNADVLKYL